MCLQKEYVQKFGVSDVRKLAKRAASNSDGPNEFDYGHITGYAYEGIHSLGHSKIIDPQTEVFTELSTKNIVVSELKNKNSFENSKKDYTISHQPFAPLFPTDSSLQKKLISFEDITDITLTTLAFLSFGMFTLQVLMCIVMTESSQERTPSDDIPSTSRNTEAASLRSNDPNSMASAITLLAMERMLLTILTEKMAELVQTSVLDSVERLIATPANSAVSREVRSTPRLGDMQQPNGNNGSHHNTDDASGMRNFSGTGVPIDDFIYRVEALTHKTLDGNFAVLCRNVSVLFEGKATEFYWRYHKSVAEVRWDRLCSALRLQFRQNRDDVDVEELIRNRKQKPNESFDAFYDSANVMIDQLQTPWSTRKLVRILKNNLRPEIRHEILNVEAVTAQELREICRRREAFLEDVKRSHGYSRVTPFRREVADLIDEPGAESSSEVGIEADIEALALVCWNCHHEGHRYQDCLEEKRVFCYGWGAANTYKPNCTRCPKNSKLGSSKSAYRPRTSNAAHNQSTMTDTRDLRPFLPIHLLDRTVYGLLDSGASISCIGDKLAAEVMEMKNTYKSVNVNAETADGRSQRITGKLSTIVEYNNIRKPMELYIVPSLKQDLYLGIDFWKAYDLLPRSLQVGEVDTKESSSSDSANLKKDHHDLTEDQSLQLNIAINCFPSFTQEGLGKTHLIKHTIDVGDAKPIKQRHFPVSPAVEKNMYVEIDRMLGVIEESESAWSSPIVMVTKPGKVRLCLDCRKVNSHTIKDAYPLPQISGILSRLPKAEYITSLDLKDAYWQVPLDVESRDKTAFTVPGRPLYQFTVMPFGLCNATSTMSRLMDKVVPPHLKDRVFIYLDDLLVVSPSFESHLEVLKEIAHHLKRAGLTINVAKSHFCKRRVKYLGHIIGDGGIRTDPEKVKAITDFPIPKTLRALRSFMGLCGWYRKFVSNFAALTAPLTDLMTTKRRFSLTPEALKAFEVLKRRLCEAPVLCNPDFNKPFAIHCDASKSGVGAVLVQETDEGDEKPVAFVSKKLNKAQRNYTVTEQECLAAIVALKQYRAYVEGHPFKIVTDHASLKWLMSNRDLSSRLGRWAIALQRFQFSIEHRKGSLHIVPDSLSRVNEDEVAAIDLQEGLFKH
ncbi:uncharacterized protein LOC116655403 [Drosophila ananassae]|uniref:uncharacterized protein LOC116655403 n=1 Tax=Drosophila ananassae TaxID=7217 RepID=UPI001CFFE9EE|nr:uncharacterized protein LOC116655403 [Drosophila ananassae]